MANEKAKQCKTNGCNNPVLDGKYCDYCNQRRKEDKDKIKAGVGGAFILGGGFAIKKGALKKIHRIAEKVIKVVLRK